MKSLRNYASHRPSAPEPMADPQKTAPQSTDGVSMESVQTYLGMSQEERWRLLLEKVAQARGNGTVTDGDLDRMAQSAKAFLSPEQYAEMLRTVDVLKSSPPRS